MVRDLEREAQVSAMQYKEEERKMQEEDKRTREVEKKIREIQKMREI